MIGLIDNSNNSRSISDNRYDRCFSEDELNLLNDLITFNYRYGEVFFNENRDIKILKMIDNIIDEKINSISPDLAFKFLNKIWCLSSEPEASLNSKILNDFECDLAVNRLSILLLDRATDDDNFFYKYISSSSGLTSYVKFNYYRFFDSRGPKANKMLMLDHIELFLGLLNSSDDISNEKKKEIVDTYLFIYRDIYYESLNKNINQNSGITLAQRYSGYERFIINEYTKNRETNLSIKFIEMAVNMLSDDNNIEYLRIGKIYLDSILMLLNEFEVDRVLSEYQDYENEIDLRECPKALSYVKKSIEERDKKTKRNS